VLYSCYVTQLDVPSRQTTPTRHIRVLDSSFRCLDKEGKRPQNFTDKGSKSASNQKSPSNPDRHETADRHETVDLGSRFPSNGTAYIYVVLIYAAQKNALVGFHRPRHHQSTTKPWWCLGPRLPQGFSHQGFTKAWPKAKPRTKPWAKPWGLVVKARPCASTVLSLT